MDDDNNKFTKAPPRPISTAKKFKGPKVKDSTNIETAQAYDLLNRYPGVIEQAQRLGAMVAQTAPAFGLGAAASVLKDFYSGNAQRIAEEQGDLQRPIDESEIDWNNIASQLNY